MFLQRHSFDRACAEEGQGDLVQDWHNTRVTGEQSSREKGGERGFQRQEGPDT